MGPPAAGAPYHQAPTTIPAAWGGFPAAKGAEEAKKLLPTLEVLGVLPALLLLLQAFKAHASRRT